MPNDDIRAFLQNMAEEPPVAPAVRPAVRRARRRLSLSTAGAIVVLILAGYGAVGLANVARDWTSPLPANSPTVEPSPEPEPEPEPRFQPGLYSEELANYVLPTFGDDRFVDYGGGTWEPSDIIATFDVSVPDLETAGFLDAYGTAWMKNWGSTEGQDLISVAMLCESEVAAASLYAAIIGTLEDDPVRFSGPPGYGQESYAFEGRVESVRTVAMSWRYEDLIVVVASQSGDGTKPLSPEVIAELAARVNGRIERNYR